ncbi:MAG TPA: hypothetical protein VG248_09865 [Caulobacteraceae bacterium]|jgi:hypothetical protein|nr:hypothetical protein [Caulobacteraceae bacterium]
MTLVRRNGVDGLEASSLESEELDQFFHHPEHDGWAQPLFAGLSATVFVVLMAAVAAVAILYSQGGMFPGPKI